MNPDELARKGYSVAALRRLARAELPRMLFDMVDGGAGDEHTLRRNDAALADVYAGLAHGDAFPTAHMTLI